MRPVIEKKRFRAVYILYIVILIIAILSVGVAIYMQFYRDEKLGVIFENIFGIDTEDTEEEELNKLKANFLTGFDNSVVVIEKSNAEIKKIVEEKNIVLSGYELSETKETYTLDVQIPYFNIDSTIPRQLNERIRDSFSAKAESIISQATDPDANFVVYNVRYKAYVYQDILSLVIISELKEGENNERIILQSYNYNLKENREVTIQELLELKALKQEDVNNKIKEEIDKLQEQNLRLKEAGYDVNIRDSSSSFYKVENAGQFFIGENGYLYIVYPYGNREYTSQMDIVIFK